MTDGAVHLLTVLAAIGCGLVAGIFFAFSTFVMRALSRLPPPQAIAAMQSINVTVLNPAFFGAFFGTALICALLAAWSLWRWDAPGAKYRLAAAALYLVGTIVVTIVCNVPRNEALAKVDPASAGAAAAWARYATGWTRWNHVRTVAAFAACAMLAVVGTQ